jgi:hypothetical protein
MVSLPYNFLSYEPTLLIKKSILTLKRQLWVQNGWSTKKEPKGLRTGVEIILFVQDFVEITVRIWVFFRFANRVEPGEERIKKKKKKVKKKKRKAENSEKAEESSWFNFQKNNEWKSQKGHNSFRHRLLLRSGRQVQSCSFCYSFYQCSGRFCHPVSQIPDPRCKMSSEYT